MVLLSMNNVVNNAQSATEDLIVMNSLTKLRIYSESDSEEELDDKFSNKLPLPSFVGNVMKKKFPSKEENSEGKIRNFPHEIGNWATYVYVPIDASEIFNYSKTLRDFFKKFSLKFVDDFHISLTRTVVLRHHWISDFTKSLKNNLSSIKSFKIYFFGLKAFTNEQKTRSFLSLKVIKGEDKLQVLVSNLDDCLTDYHLEKFYDDPLFHISLLWCPGDRCDEINNYIDNLPRELKNFTFYQIVSHCVCAIGNKKFTFSFH